ncbi:MAG: cache domain-containing protein, partial [Lachnospiraceae bacterium]|nr:cache domain-containing protein [Lachnospiraceae bacterium]
MKKKILRLMMFTVILALLAVGIATMMQLFRMRKILRDNAEYSGSQVEEYSEEAMRKQISSRLYATAVGCAYTTNMKMMDLAATVRMIADSATDIYNNPDKYGRSEVEQITPEMVGKEGAQFLWAEDVNLEDPKIKEEFSMIANFKGNLAAMYTKFPELAADYIGTESGLMLLSGPILSERWDENGNYGYLDPRERPWYKGALEEKGVYFSSVTKDYDTGLATIMCSYPVYKGDDIVAVTGAGIYLEDMDKFMLNAKIEEGGSACVVDKEGNVIFSTRNSGDLEVGKNLLSSGNKNRELLDLTKRGLYGKSAVEILEIDGENCCAAYSPVESVGWIFVSIVPEKLVTEPTT